MPDKYTRFIFERHYRRYKHADDAEIVFSELVATFQIEEATDEHRQVTELSQKLEDVLLLASFAARQRCVCLGWEFHSSSHYVRQYFRNKTLPENSSRKTIRTGDEIITLADFKEFMAHTYPMFMRYSEPAALRRALSFVIPLRRAILESDFLRSWSALEMLIYNKKRVPLRERFGKFCEQYDVLLMDLWPVVTNDGGHSLYRIRNMLAHGEYFGSEHYGVLMYANVYLAWTIERMILGLLGWRVERSTVSPANLADQYPYQTWREDRKLLTGVRD